VSFAKVLIANRGEIAVRVARTCRRLGIGVVAVYSDADRTALHVRMADEAYRIGPPPAAESYLNVDAILAAAATSGAEAIHPGYGFLSENAVFAERVVAAGFRFIGPPAAAIRALGDKAAAKRLMLDAGVPVLPGYQGDDQTDARLQEEAGRIGYPLLIKASAGGGGRGMREVRDPEQFVTQLGGARREARAAFGDDRVLLERLLLGARHVEVQVFGDSAGNVVHLGERDCSIQRRHQKIFEEAPSPAVNEDLRRRMGEAAVLAARRAGYQNAGTVEFLLDAAGAFYFLEMNTRLQVEHPVTECVTGLDLVELQLDVAAGKPLPFDQSGVRIRGHAIEARLYAEDPARGYLPSSGRLDRFEIPADGDVRVDTGFTTGATVSHYYDALLAKVICSGADRDDAVQRLAGALAGTAVEGVRTNLAQLRAVLAMPAFRAGDTTTDFLDLHWRGASAEAGPPIEVLLGATGYLLTDAQRVERAARTAADPWTVAGSWRVGRFSRRLALTAGGKRYTVEASAAADPSLWQIEVEGEPHTVEFERVSDRDLIMRRGGAIAAFTLADGGGSVRTLWYRDHGYVVGLAPLPTPDLAAAGVQAAGGSAELTAPMPGLVIQMYVKEGDRVRERQTVAVLEAMKMEHAIQSPRDGRVKRVYHYAGSRVAAGAVLVELDAVDGSV